MTSREKSSSTTPSPGCCPSDRQNLDTTSRKKELQQSLMAACCWRAALNHEKTDVSDVCNKCITFQCAKSFLSPIPRIPWGISLNSLDVLRNSRFEVGRQVRSAFRAKTSVWLNAALETQQTADVLAGQHTRLCELLKTNWAGNTEPLKNKITLSYAELRYGEVFLLVSHVDSKYN